MRDKKTIIDYTMSSFGAIVFAHLIIREKNEITLIFYSIWFDHAGPCFLAPPIHHIQFKALIELIC